MYTGLNVVTRYSGQILAKLEFSRQTFEKYSDIKFREDPFSGSRVRADGRADESKALFTGMRTRLKIGNYPFFFYRNGLYYHI
jgi:hypothetical protein